MMRPATELWHDERALTTVEYALLLVVMVAWGLVAWRSLGAQVGNMVQACTNDIVEASG